jgi:hypothetical protein
MAASRMVVVDPADSWTFRSSEFIKLWNLKGSFHLNLPLVNLREFQELVQEVQMA